MASSEYLADGHHVDDAGHLIACTYVDFRDPVERCPLTVLRKASSKRYAVPDCATIRLSKPGWFVQQGEGLADSGESHHPANGWIYWATIEPETAEERTAGRAAAPIPCPVTVKRNRQGARDGCVTLCAPCRVVTRRAAGSGRTCTHLRVARKVTTAWATDRDSRLGNLLQRRCVPDSAARRPDGRRVVTQEGPSDGAALDGPGGSGPARGFQVERLQDARWRRVPASAGSTPQRQPPLDAGGRRPVGRGAPMRQRRALGRLPCPRGGRGRAIAKLPSVREVAIEPLLVRKVWLSGNGDTAVRCSRHARRRRSSDGRSRTAKE